MNCCYKNIVIAYKKFIPCWLVFIDQISLKCVFIIHDKIIVDKLHKYISYYRQNHLKSQFERHITDVPS